MEWLKILWCKIFGHKGTFRRVIDEPWRSIHHCERCNKVTVKDDSHGMD